jgi:hypothetical protein
MTAGVDLSRVTKILSRKQIRSIVESQDAPQIALWSGAVPSGRTIASLLAFLGAVSVAPTRGLIVITGKTKDMIERNLIAPPRSAELFGELTGQVHHTAGATTANILGRTVHLVGANDVRAEDKIRGLTISLAYVDEATLLPRGFWMMLLARLRVPGARLFATINPDGPAWLCKDLHLRTATVVPPERSCALRPGKPTNTHRSQRLQGPWQHLGEDGETSSRTRHPVSCSGRYCQAATPHFGHATEAHAFQARRSAASTMVATKSPDFVSRVKYSIAG